MRSTTVQRAVADGSVLEGPLLRLAIEGLEPMFDAEKQLFCHRLKRAPGQLVREGLSQRYTIMALLGLTRSESAGLKSPIDTARIFDKLVDGAGWITNVGDLGLLIWLCALKSPGRLAETCSRLSVKTALGTFGETRKGRTTELAWFLSGLAHASLASPKDAADLRPVARETFDLLKRNQGDHGIFGHLATGGLAGRFRGRIGSFADQVYPIYALAQYSEAYSEPGAVKMARACAEAICRYQGPLGQWWWHYDAANGRVCERYPVYSVHQDGMAPMALFALGKAAGMDFSEPIYKGLQWIGGNNELACDLTDASSGVIWRSIFHANRLVAFHRKALAFSRIGVGRESTKDLTVKFECRPYHFGWLLYAFAGRDAGHSAPPQ